MTNYFWDSCVFSAFLRNESAYDVTGIKSFLEDAKAGKCKIHASTISSAEVLPSHIKVGYPSYEDFLEDFQGAVVPLDATPNVMMLSGRLRDLPYKKGESNKRRLGIPDAIILATAIHLQSAYGVKIDAFHTFDKGQRRGSDGIQPVPIVGYETWCDGFTNEQMSVASQVINLYRCNPIYPTPRLPGT